MSDVKHGAILAVCLVAACSIAAQTKAASDQLEWTLGSRTNPLTDDRIVFAYTELLLDNQNYDHLEINFHCESKEMYLKITRRAKSESCNTTGFKVSTGFVVGVITGHNSQSYPMQTSSIEYALRVDDRPILGGRSGSDFCNIVTIPGPLLTQAGILGAARLRVQLTLVDGHQPVLDISMKDPVFRELARQCPLLGVFGNH